MSKSSPKMKPKEMDQIKTLFQEGLTEAAHDPEKFWEAQDAHYAKMKPYPGLVDGKKKQKDDDSDEKDDDSGIEKALFIGPRGGKWADDKHTIPWDPKKHGSNVKQPKEVGKIQAKYPKLRPEKLREQIVAGKEFLARHEARLPVTVQAVQAAAGESGEVIGRVKELESAIGKALVRAPKMWDSDVRNLNDGSGVRVIHDTVDQVMSTVEKLKGQYKVTYEDDRINNPQGTYRSYHLDLEDPETGLQFEVQIRTQNQNVFADWAHNIYKPLTPEQEKLKTDPEVLRYEKLMADYFWEVDNGNPPPPKPSCPPKVVAVFGCL